MLKYTVCKDVKALEALQDKAIASVQSAKAKVQVALVATILHIAAHGDRTVASRFVEGLGNSVNGKAVVEWLKKYGCLTTNDEGFNGFAAKDWKAAIAASLEEAKAVMWWELKAANPFKGYSAEAALQAFIKQHKSITAKLATMPAEDAAKVDVAINEATLKQILALANFDAIISPDVETEASRLEAAIAMDNEAAERVDA